MIDCAVPVNGSVALAVNVHVPTATNVTTPLATVHTAEVDDATDAVPVNPPENVGVNVEPTIPFTAGMFEIVTVPAGGVADAGAATALRPTTLIAKATTAATPRGMRGVSPARCVGSIRSNVNMMSPHVRDGSRG